MSDDSIQYPATTGQSSPEEALTPATFDSYEFSREEAEEINRSMDMSMEFWGHVRDTSGIIPATRLKCVRDKPTRQTEMARAIWSKMSEEDLEVLKKVEGILMMTGEITIEQLFEALEKISEIINYSFQDMFPEYCNDDIINSAVSIMSELLYIYNQNEPPEIAVDEDYFPAVNSNSGFISLKKDEPTQVTKDVDCDETVEKMKRLIKKARKHGVENIRVPSSSYISDRSKLIIIEKQVNAKIRLQKLNNAITTQNISNQKAANQAKREINTFRESVQNKPAFRTAVKPRPMEYSSVVKNAPNLQMRMKKTRKRLIETQMRNDFFEGKQQEGEEVKQVSYARIFDNAKTVREAFSRTKSSEGTLVGKNQQKAFPPLEPNIPVEEAMKSLSSTKNLSRKSSEDNVNSTQTQLMEPSKDLIHLLEVRSSKKEIFSTLRDESKKKNLQKPIESNESIKQSQSVKDVKAIQNRDKMLDEMKTMLKEVLKEVGQTRSPSKDEQIITTSKVTQPQEFSKLKDTETSELVSRIDETEMKVDIQRLVSEEGDTLDISVTQDSMSPLLWPLSRDQERVVTTEISVSRFAPGPAVRLSFTNRVKSEEEGLSKLAKERPERVQEAVSYLNELLDSNAQEKESLKQEREKKPEEIIQEADVGLIKVDMPSVDVERKMAEDEKDTDLEDTVRTVNVNMAMVVEDFRLGQSRVEDARACRLWQLMVGEEPPRVQEEIGDVGATLWTSCSRQDSFSTSSMDSLYVNVDRRNLEISDSEQGYMSTASSSTTDADRFISPDKKNSTLKKDGGPSIFSLARHQQAEANSERKNSNDGMTNRNLAPEHDDRIRQNQRAKRKELGQSQESEEEEDGQRGIIEPGSIQAGGPNAQKLYTSLESCNHKVKKDIEQGENANNHNAKCLNQNTNLNLNQKDQELYESIENKERELQQIILHERQECKQSLLLEEENLKKSLKNREQEFQETFELRRKELEQTQNHEEKDHNKQLKFKDEGLNESLKDGKARGKLGDAKGRERMKADLSQSGDESMSRESSSEETRPRSVTRTSWQSLLWLPFWIVSGIIAFPITGPYSLFTKLYAGLSRTRHSKIRPTRGENSTTSSG